MGESGSRLECGRCINPQQSRWRLPWIAPAMRLHTGEVKAVTFAQEMVFNLIKPDVTHSSEHKDELFPLMVVGASAGNPGSQFEDVDLHGNIAGRKQLNINSRFVRESFPAVWPYQLTKLLVLLTMIVKEREHTAVVKDRQLLQRRYGCVYLAALQAA